MLHTDTDPPTLQRSILVTHAHGYLLGSYTPWTDSYIALRNKRRSVMASSEVLNYRSMSVSYTESSDSLMLKILAGDIILNTRVKANTITGNVVKTQLKKIPHDEQKKYGLYLVKTEKWLDDSLPLIIYKAHLQNPKVSFHCGLIYKRKS